MQREWSQRPPSLSCQAWWPGTVLRVGRRGPGGPGGAYYGSDETVNDQRTAASPSSCRHTAGLKLELETWVDGNDRGNGITPKRCCSPSPQSRRLAGRGGMWLGVTHPGVLFKSSWIQRQNQQNQTLPKLEHSLSQTLNSHIVEASPGTRSR